MRRQFWRSFRQNTSGATAAMFAIALPVLIAVVGIGFDYAHLAAMDTELQNAADEAALAGVTQLDAQPNAMSRAVKAVQGDLVTNLTKFANDKSTYSTSTDPEAVGIPAANIFFYATKADAEADTKRLDQTDSANDAKARFITVRVETRTARYALTPVVGALYGAKINGAAIAGLGSATCRTPPLMICNPEEPAGNIDKNYAFDAKDHIGDGLLVEQGGGGAWTPGNFGYLNIGLGTGANAVKQGLGWDNSGGKCIATFGGVDTIDTQTGNMASAPDALNTRFDIDDSSSCVNSGTCSPAVNTRKDLLRAADSADCTTTSGKGWDFPANQYFPPHNSVTAITDTAILDNIGAMGYPRDECHAAGDTVNPTINCANSSPMGDGSWDRNAYFYVNYVREVDVTDPVTGITEKAGTHWSSSDWQKDTKLGTSPTRYQVYKWELKNKGSMIDGVTILGDKPASYSGSTPVDYATPICSPSGLASPDRRRLSVAVVNCIANDVRGSSTGVPVQAWMDVFLVEPSLDRFDASNDKRTGKDQIYVEVIGETKSGGQGETAGSVVRRDVPYLVK